MNTRTHRTAAEFVRAITEQANRRDRAAIERAAELAGLVWQCCAAIHPRSADTCPTCHRARPALVTLRVTTAIQITATTDDLREILSDTAEYDEYEHGELEQYSADELASDIVSAYEHRPRVVTAVADLISAATDRIDKTIEVDVSPEQQ